MRMPIIALLSLFAVAAAPPPVSVPAKVGMVPQGYAVSIQIFDAKGLVAAPKLVARVGEASKVRIGDGKQVFEMVVSPVAPGQFAINGNLVQWTRDGLISDDVTTSAKSDGKPRCLTLEKVNVDNGQRTPMHVDVTISPRA